MECFVERSRRVRVQAWCVVDRAGESWHAKRAKVSPRILYKTLRF